MKGIHRLAEVERAVQARNTKSSLSSYAFSSPAKQKSHSSNKRWSDPSTGGISLVTEPTQHGERIMFFYQKFIVRKHERGLLFKDGDFQSYLAPATYRYFGFLHSYSVERFDLSQPAFTHPLLDYLIEAESEEVEKLFEMIVTTADEGVAGQSSRGGKSGSGQCHPQA